MKTKNIDILVENLTLLPWNPRKCEWDNYTKLKESIEKFWIIKWRPLLVSTRTWNNVVIWGNQRLRVAKELWIKEVPVCIFENLSEEEEKEIIIRDNVNNGDWDIDLLVEWDWTQWQLDDWWADIQLPDIIDKDKEEIEDDVPEVQEDIIVEKWDIFQLWDHRLMCGDSTNMDNVESLMGWQKSDCVVTDPPYNTWMWWKENEKARLSHMFKDNYTDEEWNSFIFDFLWSYDAFTKWDCAFYVFIDWRRVNDIRSKMEKIMDVKNVIVWDKKVHWLWSDYKSTYELCIVWKKWKPDIQNRYWLDYQDIWRLQREMWRNKMHATVKPIELLEKPIKHASKQDDIVMDLFWWSWSTLIACEKLNRKCCMMELDTKYIQVILKRYFDYTNWEKEIKCINRELDLSSILQR